MSDHIKSSIWNNYKIGLKNTWEFQYTEKDMHQFAYLSGDFNPIHTDFNFAIKKGLKNKIIYGALLSSQISRLIGQEMPDKNLIMIGFNIQFLKPSYIDKKIIFISELIEKNESTFTCSFKFYFFQDDQKICYGTVEALWKP